MHIQKLEIMEKASPASSSSNFFISRCTLAFILRTTFYRQDDPIRYVVLASHALNVFFQSMPSYNLVPLNA